MTNSDLGALEVTRLDNGLTVGLLSCPQAPLVSTVLWYRAGAAVEAEGEGGAAHFLEHMMFKGSPHFGPGEVDRRTQRLGGANNAFTSHDSTAYYFQLASDCWTAALEMESDRMREVSLIASELDHERSVILEEIAMYESEPWDALEMDVHRLLFEGRAYGRPVLGTRESLAGLGADQLRAFHRAQYRPTNAVLVVAGDIPSDALRQVERSFGDIEPGSSARGEPHGETDKGHQGGGLRRLERRHGEVARLLWCLPAPAWDEPRHCHLRLLVQALTEGKNSRLHRVLVEDEQLCAWISGGVSSYRHPGFFNLALEVVPGVSHELVESRLFDLVRELRRSGLSEEDLTRAKRTFEADWVFAHERIHHRGLTVAAALAHYDRSFAYRYRDAVLATSAKEVGAAIDSYLDPESGVLGWSLAEGRD